MSRPTTVGTRGLSLTEELERLEQQITLTLQEIDSNFSRAHRIVTGSILPIVEQYARHSGEVWEGSKFWKQFFEASANVSLSGYEEAALDQGEGEGEDEEDVTHQTDTTSTALDTPQQHEEDEHSAAGAHMSRGQGPGGEDETDDSFSVESPTQVTGVQSTPKLSASASKQRNAFPTSAGGRGSFKTSAASFRSPSPRKYTGRNPLGMSTGSTPGQPSTPRSSQKAPASAAMSSPFDPDSAFKPPPSTAQRSVRRGHNDPLMHRGVLDKNYRVQATPHTQRKQRQQHQPQAKSTTPVTATKSHSRLWDDSPDSSPAVAAPQLRSDLFSPAPARTTTTTAGGAPAGPRTPGLSVLTPGRSGSASQLPTTSTGRRLFSPEDNAHYSRPTHTPRPRASHVFSDDGLSDDDADDPFGEMSPPKTLQFHVPQSRLVQTPAREASRRIVEDLLMTAGAEDTEEIERGGGPGLGQGKEEASPSGGVGVDVAGKVFDEEDTF